ncbi:MAG: hypothetical protein JST44_19495 [Cyanobacteria bacterium SZAS LIN-5]|nr:hypothetical protein [Cyanobacteria bacterium SZAS LIN-5]
MYEAEISRHTETVSERQNSLMFSDVLTNDKNFLSKHHYSGTSDQVLALFGTVEITDLHMAQQLDQYSASDAAQAAAERIRQRIVDASKLDGASSAAGQNDIANEIAGLTTLPESGLDFDQFYVSIKQQLTNSGDREFREAFSKLDQGNIISDELDSAYLKKHGSTKASDIYSSVDNIVEQLLTISAQSTAPANADFSAIAEKVQADLSTLTAAEQRVYNYNLAYKIQAQPTLKPLLDNPLTKYGFALYFGIFLVPPIDQSPDAERPMIPFAFPPPMPYTPQPFGLPPSKQEPSVPPPFFTPPVPGPLDDAKPV